MAPLIAQLANRLLSCLHFLPSATENPDPVPNPSHSNPIQSVLLTKRPTDNNICPLVWGGELGKRKRDAGSWLMAMHAFVRVPPGDTIYTTMPVALSSRIGKLRHWTATINLYRNHAVYVSRTQYTNNNTDPKAPLPFFASSSFSGCECHPSNYRPVWLIIIIETTSTSSTCSSTAIEWIIKITIITKESRISRIRNSREILKLPLMSYTICNLWKIKCKLFCWY